MLIINIYGSSFMPDYLLQVLPNSKAGLSYVVTLSLFDEISVSLFHIVSSIFSQEGRKRVEGSPPV